MQESTLRLSMIFGTYTDERPALWSLCQCIPRWRSHLLSLMLVRTLTLALTLGSHCRSVSK